MFAGILALSIMGLIFMFIDFLERKLCPWLYLNKGVYKCIDAHVHIALNNVFNAKNWKASGKEKRRIRRISGYRKLGIGALRDGGDALFVSAFAGACRGGIVTGRPYLLFIKGITDPFGRPVVTWMTSESLKCFLITRRII